MSDKPVTSQSADLRRLASNRDWFGFLTLENAEAVGERIRALLDGRRYTWVACNEMGGYRPEVRTGQQVKECTFRRYKDGYASVNVHDTYGVWGIHTAIPDQRAAHACKDDRKRLTYLVLKRDRVEIEHYAIAGNHLFWTITVEPELMGGERIKLTDMVDVLDLELVGLTGVRIDPFSRLIAVDGLSGSSVGPLGADWKVTDLRDGVYGGFHRLLRPDQCFDPAGCAEAGQHIDPDPEVPR